MIHRSSSVAAVIAALLLALPLHSPPRAEAAAPEGDATRTQQNPNTILLSVFLKHDQAMNVEEIQKIQEKQGFWKNFPPEGTSVVNWFVMMGIGQVVILEVPASKLREVNLSLERSAWKAFRTEFYPTYNLYPVIKDRLANKEKLSL